ncbi:MAG: hypothetical protein HC896_15100 [Bacteroidales bacterium]|nr:hypothetical protein [Bacteroidales bacterium]
MVTAYNNFTKTSGSQSIDGQIDEVWAQAQPYPLAQGLNNNNIANPGDFTVTYSTLWDEDSLYMMAVITDPTHHTIAPFPWESDGIEYYFDMDNDKDMGLTSDNYQLGFAWKHSVYGDYSSDIQLSINYKFHETTNGYVMEAAVPWANGLFF